MGILKRTPIPDRVVRLLKTRCVATHFVSLSARFAYPQEAQA